MIELIGLIIGIPGIGFCMYMVFYCWNNAINDININQYKTIDAYSNKNINLIPYIVEPETNIHTQLNPTGKWLLANNEFSNNKLYIQHKNYGITSWIVEDRIEFKPARQILIFNEKNYSTNNTQHPNVMLSPITKIIK